MSRSAQRTAAALIGVFAASFGTLVPAFAGGVAEQVRQGIAAYSGKHFAAAKKRFGSALKGEPGSPTAALDLGTAQYRDGRYRKALASFRRAATDRLASLRLQERANYDQGKALAKLGDRARSPSAALGAYRKSVDAFRRALQIDPRARNAAYNIEVVRRRIRRLERKLPKRVGRRSAGKAGAPSRTERSSAPQNGRSKGTPRKPGGGTAGGKRNLGKGQFRSAGTPPSAPRRPMPRTARRGKGKPSKPNGIPSRATSSGTQEPAGRAPASSAAKAAQQILNAESNHPRIVNLQSQQVSPHVSENW